MAACTIASREGPSSAKAARQPSTGKPADSILNRADRVQDPVATANLHSEVFWRFRSNDLAPGISRKCSALRACCSCSNSMKRSVIVVTSVAVVLGKALGITVHHIDKIQFKQRWEVTLVDELICRCRHDEILAAEKWIIDGWGGWPLIERRFALADTIIFIDSFS